MYCLYIVHTKARKQVKIDNKVKNHASYYNIMCRHHSQTTRQEIIAPKHGFQSPESHKQSINFCKQN